jgi:hypothetical protein
MFLLELFVLMEWNNSNAIERHHPTIHLFVCRSPLVSFILIHLFLSHQLEISHKYLWRPRFLISVINANDRISWVKPADIGQNMVNLRPHLKNLANNP